MQNPELGDNVIDIEAGKPVWSVAEVKCRKCFHSWIAVYHIANETLKGLILECPACKNKAKVRILARH